jgi:hypothetical protein
MARFFVITLAILAAVVAGWIAAMAVYVTGTSTGWWFDRDGGLAMGFAFTIGPCLGVLAGIAAGIRAARRTREGRAP